MPFPATTVTKLTLDGVTYASTYADQGVGFEGAAPTVPAAKPGTFTAANHITLAPGHGLAAGALDIYWPGGSNHNALCTLAGDVLTLLTPGVGDQFPPVGTAATVAPLAAATVPVTIAGDRAQAFGVTGPAPGWVSFVAGGTVKTFRVRVPGDGPSWSRASGAPNPLAGLVVDSIQFSQGATTPQTMRAGVALL